MAAFIGGFFIVILAVFLILMIFMKVIEFICEHENLEIAVLAIIDVPIIVGIIYCVFKFLVWLF